MSILACFLHRCRVDCCMPLSKTEIQQANEKLADKTPAEIMNWALSLNKKTVITTSFGFNSAVTLHLATSIDENVPIVWVDSGYNVKDAYIVAEQLRSSLRLNLHVYNPLMSQARRDALLGVNAAFPDDPNFEEFKRQVKLEPFQRALDDLSPEVWITGIRKEETEHRKNLDIVSMDARGLLKVAPLFNWSEQQINAYMQQHQLPNCKHYFDPTKVDDQAECGMHTDYMI